MFYAVNKANTSDSQKIQAYQLWNLTKQLKSGELFLLRTIRQEMVFLQTQNGYREWSQFLAKKTGFTATALVDLYEKRLTDLFLLTPRTFGDGSGVNSTNGRLSDLGFALCGNIETYCIDLEAAAKRKKTT